MFSCWTCTEGVHGRRKTVQLAESRPGPRRFVSTCSFVSPHCFSCWSPHRRAVYSLMLGVFSLSCVSLRPASVYPKQNCVGVACVQVHLEMFLWKIVTNENVFMSDSCKRTHTSTSMNPHTLSEVDEGFVTFVFSCFHSVSAVVCHVL